MTEESVTNPGVERQPPATVVAQIREYVDPFLSAIGSVASDDVRDPPGDHVGTGAFIALNGSRYLLTCEHVARHQRGAKLVCELYGSGFAMSVANGFVSEPYPADVAASPISDRSWCLASHEGKCLTLNDFASSHSPVDEEYLYVYGFPEKWAHGFPETPHHIQGAELFTRECPYDPSVETDDPKPISGYHIFFDSNPERTVRLRGTQDWLSELGGMSGSLVWNTRYKEITSQRLEWKPADARITALVWAHSAKAGVLVATPVQFIQHFLRNL